MNKLQIGKNQENRAVTFLEQLGYFIIQQNFHTRLGEIDIIAKDKDTLVFVEVKYRKSNKFGLGSESISRKKIRTLGLVSQIYIQDNHINENTDIRFDVIVITGKEIEHLKSAIDFSGIFP